MFDYQGKTAVITGAASGFGLEFAKTAQQRGMNLVLADIEQDALEAAGAALAEAGAQVLTRRVDVSRYDDVAELAQACRERFGEPHLLFNNAGVASGGLIWESSPQEWQWVLGVNLWGVIHGIHAFVPGMLAASRQDPAYRGHIVNTASMAGLVNAPNMGVYNASKEGVISVSETLYHDLDLVEAPIGVSVLCPYFIPTRIADSERNRPDPVGKLTVSQQIDRENSKKAVGSGKMSAQDIARITFDGIDEGRFYLYSHPHALGGVAARMNGILETGVPPDPFAQRPRMRDALREQLRSARVENNQ